MTRRLSLLLALLPSAALLFALPALGAPRESAPEPALRARAPQPLGAPRASAALPAFQAIGLFGDLAVITPTRLASTATYLSGDFDFAFASFETGLARDPISGQVYVLGTDFVDSYLGRLDFATGQESTVGKITGDVIVDLAFDGAGTLYGLTANNQGTNPHALLRIDPATAAATVVKVLDSHGGPSDFGQLGALAWNPTDQSLYYSDENGASPRRLFIDKIAPGTFAQSTALIAPFGLSTDAMAFAAGRLWLVTGIGFYSADAGNIAAGLTLEGTPNFPTPDGQFEYVPQGLFPAALPCVPGATTACLANRFKVEVTYDATPANGTGPGNVVLESGASVKFTFFDPGNIELILKVLDACTPPFNKWWVFGGGLTNVGVTITVTDTRTGAMKTYTNTKGHLFQTFADTAAFDCP
jgi:hypothetical protein